MPAATAPSPAALGHAPQTEMVDIAGVKMPLRAGNPDLVPAVDPHYHLGGHIADICYDIHDGKNVMLTGHTGCGKTTGIEQIAARMGQPAMRVNMNGQITVGDFVGLWTVRGGDTVWVDGVLPYCMRNGIWLIVDELDFAEAEMLSVLNPVLEPNGRLFLKEKGNEVVRPHPNFRIFGTANTVGVMEQFRGLYQGTNVLNEAFLDRWHVYHVDYLAPQQEIEVLQRKNPELDTEMAASFVRVATMVRELFANEEVGATFSTRRLLDWVQMTMRYADPIRGASMTVFAKIGLEDREKIEAVMNRVLLMSAPTRSTERAADRAGANRPAHSRR